MIACSNSASYLKVQAGKTFSYPSHALAMLYVQFLCYDWSKFDTWVHADNLCSILKLVYFNNWSWQSFVSTCDVFNCLFLLDVQTQGPEEICLKTVENLWKNGFFWSRYSFVTHSIDRKTRDWGLPRSAYSIKYGKGGNKFGADFRIPETQMELNEIAWFY